MLSHPPKSQLGAFITIATLGQNTIYDPNGRC